MAESPDALIDIYLSDQWRIHGGPRKKPAREELRDRLIPVVIKVFGSVESSLDVLLKESPCSNGHQINTLIRAYALYFLRMQREAVEAGDQAAEQRFADLQGLFHELVEYEKNLSGTAEPQDNERIHATLRTSVCNLPNFRPAGSAILDSFQQDANARPLGDNPFPGNHPAYKAFEEATWKAKEAASSLISELLTAVSKPPFDFIQTILTFRVRGLSACANAALSIVGNEETAEWYEHWIEDFARFLLQDTLRKGQLKDPQADPGSSPLFTPELLPKITVDLQLQVMRVVAHYKKEAANRVLQVIELREPKSSNAAVTAPGETVSSAAVQPSLQRNDQAREANMVIVEHTAVLPDETGALADERTEAFTEQDDSDAVAKTVGDEPDDPEHAQRASIRSVWLDGRLVQHSEWTSDTDIAANGGPSYNTIQRYRSGASSTREMYVRRAFAKAFRCDIKEVPE
jgi:hypothetical protein